MWIHFSKSSFGIYGGGLKEPFRYFGRIISDKFKKENIELPFEEIEIQLALFSPKAKKDETYTEWYKKLPYYYRGKKMTRVILPVEKQKDNLEDVFLFINKAFEIITSKKKKDDNYSSDKLKSTLLQLEEELKIVDLWELDSRYENLLRQEIIEKNRQERIIREQTDSEKKRLIYDLRLYNAIPNTEERYFFPYNSQICEIVYDELRKKKFRLPDYTHILINVSDTFENALHNATRIYNWQGFGVAVYKDYKDFPKKTETEKRRIVFDLIKQGLNDIAEVDKLDKKTLNKVLEEVEKLTFA
ncbi:hypothetical protein D0T84_06645 [Dysgonomonas sp. 521]|uniref:hypothetical protein n=1 Tax=Dysgonomonas sp. 521 TaxID=2302932 RepID=UPI0013D1AC14|nr:hypothetical protein [Dysgonomonas sp. 521]NDV94600.1 hypothetical protein [Dysgonomonas sp. 521]